MAGSSPAMTTTGSPPLGIDFRLEIDAGAHADVVVMRVEEAARRALAELAQQFERLEIVAQLGRRRQLLAEPFEHDAVHVDAAIFVRPGAVRNTALVDQPVDEFNAA